jgi:CubicO group peptidase (beta-lactamase class C family)
MPTITRTVTALTLFLAASVADVTAQRADERADPPAGRFVLLPGTAIVIERGSAATSADGAAAGEWTLRMGEGPAHAVAAAAAGRWTVPALGIELGDVARDGRAGLAVTRYGETVTLEREDAAGPGDMPVARGSASALGAQSVAIRAERIRELTPRLMMALNVPGVSVALIEGGDVAWLGQFGVVTSGSAERVGPATVFEAASMSKPVYAYALLQLVDEGLMTLDAPLVQYLGRDYIADQPLHRQITARMVLAHTSGFPNWRRGDALTVDFTPGSRIGYSGEGFQYLQTAAEQVTGLSTEAFAQQRLFRPLGLRSTSYEWQPSYERSYATGHTADGTPRPRRPYTAANTAYTLYTTPEEYARILIHVMRGGAAGTAASQRFALSDALRAEMLRGQVPAPDRTPLDRSGTTEGDVHFALGWRFDRLPSGNRYWHSGSNSTGFQCYAEFDPTTGDGLVIMTNSSNGSPLWRALLREIGQP